MREKEKIPMKKLSKRGWALCIGMLTVILALAVCLGRRVAPLTIDSVTDLSRADILKQTPVELDLTVDLSAIPDDLNMRNHDQNLDIPVYQTDTTTILLKSISYANDRDQGKEALDMVFDIRYDLPNQGEVILPFDVVINGDESSHIGAIDEGHLAYRDGLWVDGAVRDDVRTFEDAALLRATGSGKKFGYSLKNAVFEEAQGTITFRGGGFNRLEYAKR